MKILLLYPPALDHSLKGKYLRISSFPMVGLNYLCSYLQKFNYDCKVYDFFFDSWEDVEKTLSFEKGDIIGITCLTESRFSSYKLLSLIRKIKKDTIIIFGGHHSTHMCDQLLDNFSIDYIVLGEGETKLLGLIQSIEGKIPLDSVEGIAYKKNGVILKNKKGVQNFISDLDSLPFPFSERHLEIFRKYPPLTITYPLECQSFSYLSFLNERIKGTIILTSRGCPFNCQFCATKKFWGKQYRIRSPQNVVDEIDYYLNNLGFRFFVIWDYTFTIMPQRCINICKEIIKRKLKIFFTCQTRADRITEELVIWLKKAGCVSIGIGVESGSSKILKEINKKISIKMVIRAFSIFKKIDLPAYPLLMVGNPGETYKTIKKTISLMKLIKPYKIVLQKTMVFPGTDLYKLAKKQGFIDDDYWLTTKPQPFYTFENSLKTLKNWEFEILNWDKKKYQLNLLKILAKLKFLKDFILRTLQFKFDSESFFFQIYSFLSRKIIMFFQIKDFFNK